MKEHRTALVTGANRGIGLEIVRQLAELGLEVFAIGRSLNKVVAATKGMKGKIHPLECDVTVLGQCKQLMMEVKKHCTSLDVLVNNAGVMGNTKALDFDHSQLHSVFDTNVFGPIHITSALWPLLIASTDARIINVSSGMAELADMNIGGYAPYRLSKWTLNGWTMIMAAEAPENVRVNSMCPGWVRTDMGGQNAPRDVQKGAETAVWLATAEDIPNGKFLRDKKEIE